MKKLNYIEEDDLLLERPNIREKCNIRSDEGMQEYLILYNTYNNLLIQFLMKEYSLINVDNELAKRKDEYKELSYEEKDMYQKSASGYLKYFYLRNNIYIERLSIEERDYLNNVYLTGNFAVLGNVFDASPVERMIYGGALRYAYDSFIGPLSASFAYSNMSKFGFYIHLGYVF